jgi:hypothetical protein
MRVYEQALMERLRIGVSDIIGPEVAAHLEVEAIGKMLEEHLLAKLTVKVLSRAIIRDTRTYHVEHPTSWWQHLKHDLYARRLLPWRIKQRWPVKYGRTEIRVHFKQYETYPKATTTLPPSRFGYPVVIETASHDINSKFPVNYDGTLAPENDCMSKPELVNHILRYVLKTGMFDLGAPDYRSMSPTDVYNVLEALEDLGVHTAGLVKRRRVV